MSLNSIDRAVHRLLCEPGTERGALAARLRRLASEVDAPMRAARTAEKRRLHREMFGDPHSDRKEN